MHRLLVRNLLLFLVCVLTCSLAGAQSPPREGDPTRSGSRSFFPQGTVAEMLALTSPQFGESFDVTDGDGVGDCEAGGGGTATRCWYDGTAWVAVASGAGGASTLDEAFDNGNTITGADSAAEGLRICNTAGTFCASFHTQGGIFQIETGQGFTKVLPASTTFEVLNSSSSPLLTVDEATGAIAAAGDVTGGGAGTFTGDLTGNVPEITYSAGSSAIVSAANCKGHVHYNDTGGVFDWTLPAASPGLNCCFETASAHVVTIDVADTSDRITLLGTAGTLGNVINSPALAGAFICLRARTTTAWRNLGIHGAWVAGGAD